MEPRSRGPSWPPTSCGRSRSTRGCGRDLRAQAAHAGGDPQGAREGGPVPAPQGARAGREHLPRRAADRSGKPAGARDAAPGPHRPVRAGDGRHRHPGPGGVDASHRRVRAALLRRDHRRASGRGQAPAWRPRIRVRGVRMVAGGDDLVREGRGHPSSGQRRRAAAVKQGGPDPDAQPAPPARSGGSLRTPPGVAAMKIHEYQAKALLRALAVSVPSGDVATTPAEARAVAARLGGRVVVKAQVHAGGRGKAGGIKLADDPVAAERAALQVLGMRLKTPQTPPEGIEVRSVLVEEASAVERELYLSITLDRARSTHVVMASQAGGMEIEEVAAQSPEKILREWAHPSLGLADYQARRLAFGLGLAGEQFRQGVALISNLFPLYLAKDCSLAEVNPPAETPDARVLALDAKLNFDDSAIYRHKEIVALRATNEEDPLDVEASKYSLNYIKLDGNVGCMVNGAGLAMATMDIIKLAGGEPANFLDVGGGASPEQIENAFRILSSDPSVKAVFINVFGGILRVDRLAEGIIAAVKKLGLQLPVVLRAEGTNVEQGKKMLAESGPALVMADDMGEGGTTHEGFAVWNTVEDAVRATGADCALIFVPPPAAADAIMEATDAGMPLVVCITEGVPVTDMVRVKAFLGRRTSRLIGPNC